jgi:DNA mismatch repair protein MutS
MMDVIVEEPVTTAQLSFFDEPKEQPKPSIGKDQKVLDQLKKLDILDLTPLQAINTLYELQKKLKN